MACTLRCTRGLWEGRARWYLGLVAQCATSACGVPSDCVVASCIEALARAPFFVRQSGVTFVDGLARREWDDDNSGAVSRDEFAKALPMLGLEASVGQIHAIFDEWDPDQSGRLEIDELNKLLRRRVELDPSLLPGAAGEIELQVDQKIALRKSKISKEDSSLLQGLDLAEEGKPIHEQVCGGCRCARCGRAAGRRAASGAFGYGSAYPTTCVRPLVRRSQTRSRGRRCA